jgi:hypothetical protein
MLVQNFCTGENTKLFFAKDLLENISKSGGDFTSAGLGVHHDALEFLM